MPKAQSEKRGEERMVIYPELLSRIFVKNPPSCPDGLDPKHWPYRPALTIEGVKRILNWETEEEYAARLLAENPKIKPAACAFESRPRSETPGAEPLLTDLFGRRVVCWNNGRNRDLRIDWALSIAQDILNGHWRLNGETIVIGRTGLVLSAQHRLIGFVLADQLRETNERWRMIHPEPLLLETFASIGLAEDQQTINTMDNTLARSDADAIKTVHAFDSWTVNDKRKVKGSEKLQSFVRTLDNGEKRKCSRMLAKATELLWDRVGAGRDEFHGRRTHSESAAFRDRHPRLLQCVKHIFEEDQGHAFGLLGLSAGQSAACLYLMGCADSDAEKYRNAPFDERNLTWTKWDLARQFWVDLAKSGNRDGKTFGPLSEVVVALANPFALDVGMEANSLQKLCVLAKAWGVYSIGKSPTVAQLTLKPLNNDDGVIVGVDERPAFGNVDLGLGREESDAAGDEMMEEANRRDVSISQVLEERCAAEIAAAQAKIDAANATKKTTGQKRIV